MKSNYLLVDYGNSFIKAAVYNKELNKCVQTCLVPNGTTASKMLTHFKKSLVKNIKRIVISVTPRNKAVDLFCKDIKKTLGACTVVVGKNEFKDLIDLSNLSPNVFVGSDIYACVLQAIKDFKQPSLVVSLGTAYFAVVVKNKQLAAAYLLPSLSYGFKMISEITAIPKELIPQVYYKNAGLDTLSSFAAGANTCIEGFIDNVAKINKIKAKNIVLTGGDVIRYANIRKKYKEVKNYVLYGLATLIKQKH